MDEDEEKAINKALVVTVDKAISFCLTVAVSDEAEPALAMDETIDRIMHEAIQETVSAAVRPIEGE